MIGDRPSKHDELRGKRVQFLGPGALVVAAIAWLAPGVDAGAIHIRYGVDAPRRMAQANLLCYETLVAFRDSHPVRFDHHHAFYASLLTNTTVMDQMVACWEAQEQRFPRN